LFRWIYIKGIKKKGDRRKKGTGYFFVKKSCLSLFFPYPVLQNVIPAELVSAQAGSGKPKIQKIFIQISLDSRFRGNDN
jgi:hypothetical protein